MFKKIIASLSLAALATSPAESPGLVKNYYPETMIVSNLDYESDLVTLTDANENTWTFTGCEDWMIGDFADLIMDDMGTENIYDDEIISIRYSGFYDTKIFEAVVGWETSNTGILLNFADGTGYYIEK